MRSAIALSIVASAAAVSAATNCNPSYNVPTSGTCFTGCNVVSINFTQCLLIFLTLFEITESRSNLFIRLDYG